MSTLGKVYLLGGGPGDPELITVRARRRLAEADIVLYDALVHPDELDACRPDVERVFVGKRGGHSSERQAHINERMIAEARAGKVVARLKGGDPYLFGRGTEEAEALHAAGIPFEVVPGVPSPLAVTAYAGISLTHRDLASSMAWVTATESVEKDRTSHDWSKLATSTQTLVIFMGMRKLDSLMRLLVEHGRPPETKAAVVQSASTPRQRTVVGTVADIAEKAREAGIGMPALTIVGDVVGLRETLRWFDTRPLFGKRVLVPRAAGQGEAFAQLLRDSGAEPTSVPTIRITPPADLEPLAHAADTLGSYSWVVFTSRNTVDSLFEALAARGGDARRFGSAKVCAVGPRTAEALAARGIVADLEPADAKREALTVELLAAIDDPQKARVLYPRSALAPDALPAALRSAGVTVDDVVAYETHPPAPEDAERLRGLLRDREIDAIGFTSSSTVENLVAALGDDYATLLAPVVLASIGPSTTATAERLGLTVAVKAAQHTTAGLCAALSAHYATTETP